MSELEIILVISLSGTACLGEKLHNQSEFSSVEYLKWNGYGDCSQTNQLWKFVEQTYVAYKILSYVLVDDCGTCRKSNSLNIFSRYGSIIGWNNRRFVLNETI